MAAVVASLPVAALAAVAPVSAQQGETGIHASFALSALDRSGAAVAGRDGGFAFTLTTGANHAPLRGAKPAAWLLHHTPGSKLDARQCRGIAAGLVRGASLAVPALDLNAYYVVILGNAAAAVVDPRNGFGGSNLIALASFDATVSDWALGPDQTILAVALPTIGQVALVDTRDWSVAAKIAVPNATRLALAPNGRMLLASYRTAGSATSGESGVALIDLTAPASPALHIATGGGPHDIAIDEESRFAFVSNAAADNASIIDLATRELAGTVPTGRRPVALAYSALARRAYAAAENGSVTVIGGPPFAAVATIAGLPGTTALRVAPGGRFVLAASPASGAVIVIDAATDRIVQRVELAGEPDAIAFSDSVAYLRRRATEFVEAWPLDQVGVEGRSPTGLSIGAGRLALGAASAPTRADPMMPVPGGDGLMIANPGDRAIYFYREGMSAPSGSLPTYGQEPRAVRVVDRRLREAEPGVYRTVGRLPRAGTYDLVLYLDSPRLVQCSELRIDRDPAGAAATSARPRVTDMALGEPPRAGEPLRVTFRLVDPETGMPVSDVRDARVLSFRIPGSDAARSVATPRSNGAYEASVTWPVPGDYYVFVEARSVGLAPTSGRLVAVAPAVPAPSGAQ